MEGETKKEEIWKDGKIKIRAMKYLKLDIYSECSMEGKKNMFYKSSFSAIK